MLQNGKRLFSRIFEDGDDALKEAEEERQRMLAEHWKERDDSTPLYAESQCVRCGVQATR